jgi:hypothetical protein
MTNKLTFSIKKYNSESKKTSFYKDVSDIFSQNILFQFNNFSIDLEMENEMNLGIASDKFYTVYNRKISSISNQNFILTFSLLDEIFFENNDVNLFTQRLYNALNNHFTILSFVTVRDGIGDITFYCICSAIVKNIFLDHIQSKVIEAGKNLEELIGVLSYNLILGGTKSEAPEQKFIQLLISELNKSNYDLEAATEHEKNIYILNSYIRASTLLKHHNILLTELLTQSPNLKSTIKDIIEHKNLDIQLK